MQVLLYRRQQGVGFILPGIPERHEQTAGLENAVEFPDCRFKIGPVERGGHADHVAGSVGQTGGFGAALAPGDVVAAALRLPASRMASLGSTALTRIPLVANWRDQMPVPAPTSAQCKAA